MAAITDLAAASSVASTDNLVVNQSGTDRKVTANKFAIVALSNTFTATQNINPTGANNAIYAGMALGNSGEAFAAYYNGVRRFIIREQAAVSQIRFDGFDNGTGLAPYISVERNNNASTPAPGHVILERANGSASDSIYPDNSGVWRTLAANPTSATFAGGTVIGAQTSSLDSKNIVGNPISIDEVLEAVLAGADAVRRFTYKSGAFNGEEFSGVVVDHAPRYGMDRDTEHPAGRALNEITVIGDLLMAVAHLVARVAALEAQVAGS